MNIITKEMQEVCNNADLDANSIQHGFATDILNLETEHGNQNAATFANTMEVLIRL